MNFRDSTFAVLVLCVVGMQLQLSAAENILINYDYAQTPQVDFSKMPKGPLKVAPFSDKRDINSADLRLVSTFTAEMPITDIVNNALVQAFEAGGAALVQEGQTLTLEGELTEVLVANKGSGSEVTIRTHVTLKRGSQTVFDNIIFGRAEAPTLDAAVKATFDKLVNSLILDDYFLMEII